MDISVFKANSCYRNYELLNISVRTGKQTFKPGNIITKFGKDFPRGKSAVIKKVEDFGSSNYSRLWKVKTQKSWILPF